MSSTSSDLRGLLRDLALILGIPFIGVVGILAWWQPWVITYQVPEGTDIFTVAAGSWDWAAAEEVCLDNSHTLSFTPDRSLMLLTHHQPWTDSIGVEHRVTEYEVIEHSREHIRGAIRGETRLTDSGEPVVWDLVLTSPDTYRWHRTDWIAGAYTNEVQRCGPA